MVHRKSNIKTRSVHTHYSCHTKSQKNDKAYIISINPKLSTLKRQTDFGLSISEAVLGAVLVPILFYNTNYNCTFVYVTVLYYNFVQLHKESNEIQVFFQYFLFTSSRE